MRLCRKVTGWGERCLIAGIGTKKRGIVGNARHNPTKLLIFCRKDFSFLDFGSRRWKISRSYFAGEIGVTVRAVAKRLVGGVAAAAKSDGGASGEAEFISGEINDLEIAFD